MSTLLIVSGASGAGKSTLCKRLLDRYDDLVLSVSTTTRAPRGAERDGVEYQFVDDQRFTEMVGADEFAEWAEVHGNRYGTSKAAIDHARRSGQSVLFDIDYQGARSLMKACPDAIAVMVIPPDMTTLEARLRGRGTDSDEVVQGRMNKAQMEMAHGEMFHYLVVNDDLEAADRVLDAIFVASRSRTSIVWPSVCEAFDLSRPGFRIIGT